MPDIAPPMRPTCVRPKYCGTSPPRTMVTRPLDMPNTSANTISIGSVSPTAKNTMPTGRPVSTTTPSRRSDQPRPTHTYTRRPATWAGPTVISTTSASASLTPLDANTGITCAHSAADTKACSMKQAVSIQKARERSASCSVASSRWSTCRAEATRAGPRRAQPCRGVTSSSSIAPTTASVGRQPSQGSNAAMAGNDSVLAKPPTSVSMVMPCW